MKRLVVVAALAAVVLMLLGGGGYAYAARMESHDAFCASCHTEPETTYYQQSLEPQPPTLAAFHAREGTRCIDCHSGKGVPGRFKAMLTGARDMLAFRLGRYQQPARTTRPVGNAGCTKCHNMPLTPSAEPGEGPTRGNRPGLDGHYHADSLEAAWGLWGGPANRCALCHPAHLVTAPQDGYTLWARVEQGCDACHQTLGEGPGVEGGEHD